MAASPMALLPSMRTLLTIHLDCHLGANNGAYSAAGAFAVIGEHRAEVTCSVQFIGLRYSPFGTEAYAELASLAQLAGYDYIPFDHFRRTLFIWHDY
jgi:hypothetical protein